MSDGTALFRQVAREAGVSPSSVTLALQGSPRISPATKKRVFLASRKLGYRASKVRGIHDVNFAVLYGSTSLLTNITSTIGSTLDAQIWEGIAGRASELGVSLFNFNVDLNGLRVRFEPLPALLRRDQLDGIVLMGNINEAFVRFLRRVKVPFVVVGNDELGLPVDQVKFGMERGLYDLVVDLHRQGKHKRFGLISAASEIPINQQLIRGFRSALTEIGALDENLIAVSADRLASGFELAGSVLGQKHPPTFLFGTNIRLAIESAITAARMGIAYDSGLELATAHNDPTRKLGYPLHLLSANLAKGGRWVFDRLMTLHKTPQSRPCTLEVDCVPLFSAGL